jgi:hypothetical protein
LQNQRIKNVNELGIEENEDGNNDSFHNKYIDGDDI